MTSRIITRWWLAAVGCRWSSASEAAVTAEAKPIENSVKGTSLSMVLGMPMKGYPPCRASRLRIFMLPSPPMPISPCRPSSWKPSTNSCERFSTVPSGMR